MIRFDNYQIYLDPLDKSEIAQLDASCLRVRPDLLRWWQPGYEHYANRGVGDLIKHVTDALGIKQCGACKQRQERWNKK